MKKILAMLLAMAMLLSFGAMGAMAAETELEAQGRALLEETIAVFNSWEFTLRGQGTNPLNAQMLPLAIAMDGDRVAFETSGFRWYDLGLRRLPAFGMRLLLGSRTRAIIEADRTLFVFPARCVYFRTSGIDFFDGLGFIDLEMPEDIAVTQIIAGPVYERQIYIRVAIEQEGAVVAYYYYDWYHPLRDWDGQLVRVTTTNADGETMRLEIDYFSGTADSNMFSTRWMLGIPLRF